MYKILLILLGFFVGCSNPIENEKDIIDYSGTYGISGENGKNICNGNILNDSLGWQYIETVFLHVDDSLFIPDIGYKGTVDLDGVFYMSRERLYNSVDGVIFYYSVAEISATFTDIGWEGIIVFSEYREIHDIDKNIKTIIPSGCIQSFALYAVLLGE